MSNISSRMFAIGDGAAGVMVIFDSKRSKSADSNREWTPVCPVSWPS